MAAEPLPVPPVVPWQTWYAREYAIIKQGFHILFCGPTQSGKTVLCRKVTRLHNYAVVLGTKPRDKSLEAYEQTGYKRIDHWPPTKRDMEDQSKGEQRYLLWPKITRYEDLWRHRPLYKKAMDSIFVDGNWCLVVDEGLWVAGRKGLNLGDELSAHAYGAASNGVSMHLLVQRPANIPPITWGSCMQALVFHGGNTRDIRELASLGTYQPRAAAQAVQNLRGHQFLDLPCRGKADWSVSEVDLVGGDVTRPQSPDSATSPEGSLPPPTRSGRPRQA